MAEPSNPDESAPAADGGPDHDQDHDDADDASSEAHSESLGASATGEVRVGCAGLPSGVARAAYFEHLDLLEVETTFFEPPGEVALRRWRREAPPACGFTALAWQLVTHDSDSPGYARLNHPLDGTAIGQVGSFRDTQLVRDAWARSVSAAQALAAEVLLLETPPSFTPSESHREALRRFVGEVAGNRGNLALAWEPHGIWEPAEAAKLALELGLIYALDPLQLEEPPPEEPEAYFRLHGLGIYRNKISADMLELLAEMIEGYERAWVVFANVEKYRDAQHFHKLLAGREFVAEET